VHFSPFPIIATGFGKAPADSTVSLAGLAMPVASVISAIDAIRMSFSIDNLPCQREIASAEISPFRLAPSTSLRLFSPLL
jgi:hypothetical protein